MASTLAQNLNKFSQTDQNVSDINIYSNIVNSMDDPGDLPNYRAGSDFTPYGQELRSQPDVFNGYLSTLVKKYGVIFQRAAMAQNPLSMFKKGIMPYGGTIQSVVYDTVAQKEYNPFYRGPIDSPFRQNLIEPDTASYNQTEDISTPVTIIDTYDTVYFQNLSQFHDYVWGKIVSLVNGAILDEFYHTKLTLAKPVADTLNGATDSIKVKHIARGDSKTLAKTIKVTSKKFRYFSRDNNASGINQASLVNNIVVIVDVDHSVELDMDYFGQLFNPENSRDFNVQYVEIDKFPDVWVYSQDHKVTKDDLQQGYLDAEKYSVGDLVKKGSLARKNAPDAVKKLNGEDLACVVLDRDALQVWDNLPIALTTIPNPKGRYNNVYLNKKASLAFIKAFNAVAIMDDGGKNTGSSSSSVGKGKD